MLRTSGKFYKQENNSCFLYGKFDVEMEHLLYDYDDYGGDGELCELYLRCNFKNNKLDGLYHAVTAVDNDKIMSYREYKDDIRISDVLFDTDELIISLYDQSGKPYKQYKYNYPELYADENVLLKHFPDLDVYNSESFDSINTFINNVMSGNYHEFELYLSKSIQNNEFTSHDKDYIIIKRIARIDNVSNEVLNNLFNI